MPSTHVNRESVTRRKQRLLAAYDDVHVQELTDEVTDAAFPEFREHCREGYTGGGYAWVVREPDEAAPLTESMPDVAEDRRVLMILGRGGTRWGLPGGGREDGESYEEAAVREVREETGIDCAITDCFLVREAVTVAPSFDDRLHTLWVFFDATYAGGQIEIQPGELNGAAWFAEPPPRDRLRGENAFRAADFWPAFEAGDDPLADPFS